MAPAFRWKTLLLLALASGTWACGSDPGTVPVQGATAAAVVAATPAQLARGDAVAGSYIVTFRHLPGASPGLSFQSFAAELRAHYTALASQYLSDPRVKDLRFLTSVDMNAALRSGPPQDAALPPYLGKLAASGSLGTEQLAASMAQVDFATPADAEAALREWDAAGGVWLAEPNYVSRLAQDPTTDPTPTPTPVDNVFKQDATDYAKLNYWWLTSINLTQAYEAIANRDQSQPGVPSEQAITTNRPIIAILDSGIDYEHPALKDRIWINTKQNEANCDNDLHGCNTTVAKRGKLGDGDVWPFDTTGPNQDCNGKDPNCSHGTHVAGLIAADEAWTDPETGRPVAGVCPVCQIMILKIVSKVGKESGILDSSIIAAFKYVTLFRHDNAPAVRVINASFGKFVRSRSVGILVRLMKDKNGTLLIGAAGNEDTLTEEFPAAFSDAIAVAAVDSHLRKVSFSNFGRWVDISAPGSQMLSTVPGGAVDVKSGTSMAAPMVTGVAGLMLARYPDISFNDLRSSILNGADPTFYNKDFEGGFNYNYYYPKIEQESVRQPLLGNGLLNANAAINKTPSQNLPLFTDLDRVKPGCAVVGAPGAGESAGIAPWLLLAGALLPLLLAGRRRVRGSTSGS